MKDESIIAFLTELLELTGKLHDLVEEQCRLLIAEDQDGHLGEGEEQEDIPF